MRHSKLNSIPAVTALLAVVAASSFFTLPLRAATPQKPVAWTHLCSYAGDKDLFINTTDGSRVTGRCASVEPGEVLLKDASGNTVRIVRSQVLGIEVQATRWQRLRELHKDVHGALQFGVRAVFSPAAPIGLVAVPGTLAWGAVAAPFCFLGDLAAPDKQHIWTN